MPFLAFIVAIAIAWMAQAGMFYQTGNQWFQACWTQKYEKRSPANSDESIAWAKCEPATQRAVFNSGFFPSGNPADAITPELKALVKACPSNYSDIPMFGMNLLAVDIVEKSGGPNFIDRFLPPDSMIARAFKSRWPNCPAIREANGFPKIVLRGEAWELDSPCKPCEAEKKAIEASRQSK